MQFTYSSIAIFAFSILLHSQTTYALPLGDPSLSLDNLNPELSLDAAEHVNFRAITALNNCSGSVVRFNTSLGNDPALVLTNGHCYEHGFLAPGKVISHETSNREFAILSPDGRTKLGTIDAERILFATMTKTDIALYQTGITYDALEKRWGIVPLTLSDKHPSATRSIAVASGYWKKIYSCRIDGFVHEMREGRWTWLDSIRYTQPGCEVIGGTSGSPIIDTDTYEVVGVNNTVTSGGTPCSVNNPCEVDETGNSVMLPKGAYGQQTFWLYSCLSPTNDIDLNKAGCRLPKEN